MRSSKKMVAILVLLATLCSAGAQAQPGRGPRRHGPIVSGPRGSITRPPAGARRFVLGGVPYWVHGGLYYRLSGGDYIIVSAPVVRHLPRHHRAVVIGGIVYYVADDVYYRTAPGGYVIVERPVEPVKIVAPPAPEPDEITLHVPKRSGRGFVRVTLRKLKGGFLGPQGEFYPVMPSVELLTEMYGLHEGLRNVRSDVFFIHVPKRRGGGFVRVTLTRYEGGFLGPQGEFYPLMPSVAHLSEMYGTPEQAGEPHMAVVRLRVPRRSGQGFVDVELKRHERGYLGPQGEFYPELPSADQLVQLYGDQ